MSNILGHALEEELTTVTQYTQCASDALPLGESGHLEAFWFDWRRVEKQQLKDSIHNVKLHWYKYLYEVHKTFCLSPELGTLCFPLISLFLSPNM